ncbi:MAG: MGH1-like glycoside hydrolase domain-containing protein [Candidatus Helarchaeota archaeon]
MNELWFVPAALIGMICGLISNVFIRKRLAPFRENYWFKFRASFIYGIIITFSNFLYWIGCIGSLVISKGVFPTLEYALLLLGIPLCYAISYIFARLMGDELLGKSPAPPTLKTGIPLYQEGVRAIFRQLERNLNAPFGRLRHRWAMPAGKYMAAYLWDSAFIALIWNLWDQQVAREILLTLIDNQTNDGRIPHYVSFLTRSKLTQPPLLAWAITNLDVNPQYLKYVYPKLKKFHHWFYKNRRSKTEGLYFWQHPYESGMDNSPRFTDRSEKNRRDLTQLAAIDLNCFIILQIQALIHIAEQLRQTEDSQIYQMDLKCLEKRRNELIELVQAKMWDEEEGLYFDYDMKIKQPVRINTIASFFPLIAGIPTTHQVDKLILHLLNPKEYNTLIPLPSVALNEEFFEKDAWRGPVWINTAYLVIKGLEKYQKFTLSRDFTSRLIEGVFQTWKREGSFYEFYDPERYDLIELSRKKGNLWKRLTLGNKPIKNFIGWTGLINCLLTS